MGKLIEKFKTVQKEKRFILDHPTFKIAKIMGWLLEFEDLVADDGCKYCQVRVFAESGGVRFEIIRSLSVSKMEVLDVVHNRLKQIVNELK